MWNRDLQGTGHIQHLFFPPPPLEWNCAPGPEAGEHSTGRRREREGKSWRRRVRRVLQPFPGPGGSQTPGPRWAVAVFRPPVLVSRSRISACPTSTAATSTCRRFAAALSTRPRRSSTGGRTGGPRWTPGPWACCCTPWFTAPCRSTGKTTGPWCSRSAQGPTGSPASPLVSLGGGGVSAPPEAGFPD